MGASIFQPSSGGTTLTVQEEGSSLAVQSPPIMNFTGAGTASVVSGKYQVSIPAGSGGGTPWQAPSFTIYFDGTTYSARREIDQTVPYTSNTSLHNVFNSAVLELSPAGNTGYTSTGGLIALAQPSANVMTTLNECVLGNQITVVGPGRGLTVRAGGGANWSSGTVAAPKAVFNADQASRVRVEGVRIDCAGLTGTTGILFEKGGGATGGNSAHSYFLFNEVTGFDVTGMQIGKQSASGGTSTAWLFGNQIVNDVANSNSAIGVAFFQGDAHYGWGNNIKIGGSNSICMVIQANSVHVLNGGHMVNNGGSTHPLISIHGANPCRVEGVYFDNLTNRGAVGVNLNDGSPFSGMYTQGGQSNRIVIANNWGHFTGNPDNTLSFVELNAANAPTYGVTVANNVMEADTATTRFKSMVNVTNGTNNHAQDSLAMLGNQAMNCVNFITADNGYVDGGTPGTFVGQNMNQIENSQGSGGTIRKGPA